MASPVIALCGVRKAFGRHLVIDGLDLTVPAQSVFAFLGNNGAGKSTTIRLMTGLLRPDAGSIRVLGLDVQTERRAVLRQVGALVDSPCLYPNLTAAEFLAIGCTLKDLPRNEIGRVLELVSLGADRNRQVSQFSLGMRQRLAIAHALLGSPKLLILDEPSNGLDPEGKRDMRSLLASLPARTGSTVFVSSHNLDEVEKIATHVAVIKGGALRFQGPLAGLQARQAGALAIDVGDAAHAAQVLAAAHYQAEPGAQAQVIVRGVERAAADKVHALLVCAGVRLYQSVYHTPSLEQWFLEDQCELIAIELQKTRRSLALLMMAAAPLIVVVFNLLMMLKRSGIATLGSKHWASFWMGNTALWAYFMLPLYIALVTGLLNGQEHRNNGWRLMLTLPVSQWQLYLAKALLAWLFVACSNLLLAGATALAIALLGLAGAPLAGAFDYPMLALAAKLSIACLPIILVQHAVAWRVQHLMAPLALGVFATMGILQVGSSEHWMWYPWTYPLMAANGSDTGFQHTALLLAAGLGALLLAAGTALLARRDIAA